MSEEVITRFDQMDISTEVLKAIEKMGFTEPSTVQAKTIPLMMSGVDIMAIAPTGTGKTCAFGIPMLEYMDLKDKRIQEVVLCPTRELAVQIGEELTKLAAFIPQVRIAVLYGGQPHCQAAQRPQAHAADYRGHPRAAAGPHEPGQRAPGRGAHHGPGRSRRDAEYGLCEGREPNHRIRAFPAAAGDVLRHHEPGGYDHRLALPA